MTDSKRSLWLIEKLYNNRSLTLEEYECLVSERNDEAAELLRAYADRVRR